MIFKEIKLHDFVISNRHPFVLIAGPCAMESKDHALEMSHSLVELTNELEIPFIYKSSFDKSNRTSLTSKRGVGLEKSLDVFQEIKKRYKCPVITDVHLPEQCDPISEVVDIIQIPAFLCRQTDLLIAAAKTGKILNIKKGQFLSPWDMVNVVNKVSQSGNDNIMLCERGASFGYNTLVSDMRSIPVMSQTGYPVIFDATHSVQQPGGLGGATGGQREFAQVLARAAIAVGVAGIFAETHENPEKAPSDGPNMIRFKDLPDILRTLKEFDKVAKNNILNLYNNSPEKAVA